MPEPKKTIVPATKLVILESRFAGDREKNFRYTCAAMRDCLERGESPYASHVLLTQPGVLDDDIPNERRIGIDAGFLWHHVAERSVVYTDLGISSGMREGIEHAVRLGKDVEYRTLPNWEVEQNKI